MGGNKKFSAFTGSSDTSIFKDYSRGRSRSYSALSKAEKSSMIFLCKKNTFYSCFFIDECFFCAACHLVVIIIALYMVLVNKKFSNINIFIKLSFHFRQRCKCCNQHIERRSFNIKDTPLVKRSVS